MNPIVRNGRWIIAGTVIAGLAVIIPTLLSREVVSSVGIQAAIAPTPMSAASRELPLTALASAIGDQGQRRPFTDTYSSQYVDIQHGQVLIYVTNMPEGRAMLRAALRADPGIDLHLARLVPARFTLRQLNQGIRRLLAARAPAGPGVAISGAAPAQNGSSIDALVQLTGAAGPPLAAIRTRLTLTDGGIPVTVSLAPPPQPGVPG